MDEFGLQPVIIQALAGIFVLLTIASIIVALIKSRLGESARAELVSRIQSWWLMVAVFTVAMVITRNLSLVFFALVSFLALKEYLSLVPTRRVDRRVMFWAYLTIPAQYVLVGMAWYGMFIILVPVYAFLLLPMRMVLAGETRNFLRAAGILHWGLMAMVFSISHVAFLLVLPEEVNPGAGGAGLVLFLVFLTQFNDVAQYCWGKLLGRHKALPTVSPGKTLEGLVGGVVTTVVLAWLLAPWLTPLTVGQSLAAGLLIGMGGFIGDVTISALKRDLGVKDSGSLLPGHGGILDRIDSLIYTAPLFFHFVYYLHY
ncbi:MAG: phosphatidate cytidylyltransferase [Wenzhouxiangella sp.]|nr:MAG: phosphatidate cytidylyltransferase [Wenzhouxiangella sp.]